MARALTTQERAQRQRAMIALRSWMEKTGISRQEIADQMGITKGHLSTLINANRTASQDQVDLALTLVNGAPPSKPASAPKAKKPKAKKSRAKSKKAEPRPTKVAKPNNLRPMNKFETDFVITVAKAWIAAHPGGDKDELVEIVRSLSIGIRS